MAGFAQILVFWVKLCPVGLSLFLPSRRCRHHVPPAYPTRCKNSEDGHVSVFLMFKQLQFRKLFKFQENITTSWKLLSCGMWLYWEMCTDVSEEHSDCIIRVDFTGSCPRRKLSLQARQWELHIWPKPLCFIIASPSRCPVFTGKPSWNSSSDRHLVVWVVTWFNRTATDERVQVIYEPRDSRLISIDPAAPFDNTASYIK